MIVLGGLNGTGKTSVCEALERLYGLKCEKVETLCYEGERELAFEVFAFGITMMHMRGDVVDESPLTHYLYVLAIPSFKELLEEEPEEYSEVAEGILMSAKKLKEKGARLVWLRAKPQEIMKRLKKEEGCKLRPFIEETAFMLGELRSLEERALKDWGDLVDLVIDTTEKTPEEVAREVWERLGKGEG